jgi:hypothetical protein
MYVLGVHVPLYSSLGLRALLGLTPFMPALEVNQETGKLRTNENIIISTLTSRLVSLWRNIFKARERFESEADTGELSAHSIFLNYFFLYQ